MPKKILVAFKILLHVSLYAQPFEAVYTFNDVDNASGRIDPTKPPEISGLLFEKFEYSGNATNSGASGRFSFNGWPVGAVDGEDNYGNFTAAVSPTVYYQVTIKLNEEFVLNLNKISFSVRRTGTGPRTWCIRSSIDHFAENLSVTTSTNSKLSTIATDYFFWKYDSVSASSDQKGCATDGNTLFTQIKDSISFRIYATNSESNGGSFSIDNFTISGEVYEKSAVNISRVDKQVPKICVLQDTPNSLKIATDAKITHASLLSSDGRFLPVTVYTISLNNYKIHLSDINDGVYYLIVCTPTLDHTKKLLILR